MTGTQAVMDANYPELLRLCMIVNAPKVFELIYNILKPLLPKSTSDKIDIYGVSFLVVIFAN